MDAIQKEVFAKLVDEWGVANPKASAAMFMLAEEAEKQDDSLLRMARCLNRLIGWLESFFSNNERQSQHDPLEAIRQQLAGDDRLNGVVIRRNRDKWEVSIWYQNSTLGVGTGHTWAIAYDAANRDAIRRTEEGTPNAAEVACANAKGGDA